jgi:uncharacterized protein
MHTHTVTIVPLYTAILALIFVFLSIRTIRLRRSLKIGIGHANNDLMLRAMRVHSNFAEYTPISCILLFFLEQQNAYHYLIHGLCMLLIVGRCLHAYGVSQENERFIFRVTGTAMTFTAIISSALHLLILGVTL